MKSYKKYTNNPSLECEQERMEAPRPCSDDTAFWGDTVRYKYVTNRPVATPTFSVDRNTALGTGSMLVDMLSVKQRPR